MRALLGEESIVVRAHRRDHRCHQEATAKAPRRERGILVPFDPFRDERVPSARGQIHDTSGGTCVGSSGQDCRIATPRKPWAVPCGDRGSAHRHGLRQLVAARRVRPGPATNRSSSRSARRTWRRSRSIGRRTSAAFTARRDAVPPVVADGVAYVGYTGGLQAYDAAGAGAAVGHPGVRAALDRTDRRSRYDPLDAGRRAGRHLHPVRDGDLYAYDAAGVTGCSGSPKTCTPLWTAHTGYLLASPAVAAGRVYTVSSDGVLSAFDAAGKIGCSGTPEVLCATLDRQRRGSGGLVAGRGRRGRVLRRERRLALRVRRGGHDRLHRQPADVHPVVDRAHRRCGLGGARRRQPRRLPRIDRCEVVRVRRHRDDRLFGLAQVLCATLDRERRWGHPALTGRRLRDGVRRDGGQTRRVRRRRDDRVRRRPEVVHRIVDRRHRDGGDGGSPTVANHVVYSGSGPTIRAFDARGTTGCSGSPKSCTPLWSSPDGSATPRERPVVVNGTLFVIHSMAARSDCRRTGHKYERIPTGPEPDRGSTTGPRSACRDPAPWRSSPVSRRIPWPGAI